MLPDMDVMKCGDLAVPMHVMQHVVRVESSFNRFAIGVVGGRLVRQPHNLPEALATARMLRERGFNFSLGLAQVNRDNLGKYHLTLERAFDACPNLQAGTRILADCHARSGNDWGKALSCYYSGNFASGFRDGYVQKVLASMRGTRATEPAAIRAIPVVQRARDARRVRTRSVADAGRPTLLARRIGADDDAARSSPATEGVTSAASVALATPAPVAGPPASKAAASGTTAAIRIDAAFVF